MTGAAQTQIVSACHWAGKFCIPQFPLWLVPCAKVLYFLASYPWININFCSTECVWYDQQKLFVNICMNEGNKHFFCPISCTTLKILVTLTSLLCSQSAPSFLRGLDFLLCHRQASKLAPRHLSWLSALSCLGETNRCAFLLFSSEFIIGFQAGEISKVSLASAFSSKGGVTCSLLSPGYLILFGHRPL